MKENKICPVCKAIFESNASVCPDCGLTFPDILIEQPEIFSAGKRTLYLDRNNLYGIGDNRNRQISNEPVDNFKHFHFIADNVVCAAASANYSAYVTADGEVKILGDGCIAKHFPGFSGAKKVYATPNDAFYIVTGNGSVFAFGNNLDGVIESESESLLLRRDNLPLDVTLDAGYLSYLEPSHVTDYIESHYLGGYYCDDNVKQEYTELIQLYGEFNIKSICSFYLEDAYEERAEDFIYHHVKGTVNVLVYKSNKYICTPIELHDVKFSDIQKKYDRKAVGFKNPETYYGAHHALKLDGNKLYGIGGNQCGQISDICVDSFENYELIADNVISAAAGNRYTVYITTDGEVTFRGYGILVDRFAGFSGAKKVYATPDDHFFIVDKNDEIFALGNNSKGALIDSTSTEVYRKDDIDFEEQRVESIRYSDWISCLIKGQYSTAMGYRHWNISDSLSRWETLFFETDTYLKDESCGMYKTLTKLYSDINIERQIEFIDYTEEHKDGIWYFKAQVNIKYLKHNNYYFEPISISKSTFERIMNNYPQISTLRKMFADGSSEMKLVTGVDCLYILNKGKLYGIGDNSKHQISDSSENQYSQPHHIADNVVSIAAKSYRDAAYAFYATNNGKIFYLGDPRRYLTKSGNNSTHFDTSSLLPSDKKATQILATHVFIKNDIIDGIVFCYFGENNLMYDFAKASIRPSSIFINNNPVPLYYTQAKYFFSSLKSENSDIYKSLEKNNVPLEKVKKIARQLVLMQNGRLWLYDAWTEKFFDVSHHFSNICDIEHYRGNYAISTVDRKVYFRTSDALRKKFLSKALYDLKLSSSDSYDSDVPHEITIPE